MIYYFRMSELWLGLVLKVVEGGGAFFSPLFLSSRLASAIFPSSRGVGDEREHPLCAGVLLSAPPFPVFPLSPLSPLPPLPALPLFPSAPFHRSSPRLIRSLFLPLSVPSPRPLSRPPLPSPLPSASSHSHLAFPSRPLSPPTSRPPASLSWLRAPSFFVVYAVVLLLLVLLFCCC